MRLAPWWERFPARFELEKRSLDDWGIEWKVDDREFKNGRLHIQLTVPREGEYLDLEAQYPDTFPYTPFEVIARSVELDHHIGPFDRNLCLLRQGDWSTADTLAGLLQSQLDDLMLTGSSHDPDDVEGREALQGEPISEYYPYPPNVAVLIDGSWAVANDARKGTLELGFIARPDFAWLGAVTEMRDANGSSLASLDKPVRDLFPSRGRGRWVRSDSTIVESNPSKFLDRLIALDPDLARPSYSRVPSHKSSDPEQSVDIIGVIQPEEHQYRAESDGWVFLVRGRLKRNGLQQEFGPHLVRADRYGRADLGLRIPELSPLGNSTIALVGLGCIGAPSALQFARSGLAELRILDHDRVDAGTTARWPFGVPIAGEKKVQAIANFINKNYPYTRVVGHEHRLGTALKQLRRDNDVLPELLDGAGLLFDASADLGIQHLLSDFARERNVPYIGVNSTFGGWGGTIIRVRPGLTEGCWVCLEYWQQPQDGSIPRPPRKLANNIQPAGCGSPTFEAASFDVESIALAGVRTAVSTLCSGVADAFPPIDWDVAVISLRDALGHVIPPSFQKFSLRRHPSCQNHR